MPSLHFMSMSVFQSSPLRSDLRDRGEFRRTAGRLSGPRWKRRSASGFGRCCAAASVPRMVTGRFTTPSPGRSRAMPLAPYLEHRTLQPQRLSSGQPRPRARPHPAANGDLFLATRDALAQASPTAPNPYRGITAAADSPQAAHRSCSAAFPGWRRRRRRAFPGPSGRRIWRGCSPSSSSSSFACRFPAWRWRRSRRPGGSSS